MELNLAREIIACLPRERTLYHYYKDRYAVELLRQHLAKSQQKSIAALRTSPYARLLDKPLIKALLANWGRGIARVDDLDNVWSERYETYVLTLDTWGNRKRSQWDQVSRPGTNLVLQLNFSNRHDKLLDHCGFQEPNYFNNWGHPVSQQRSTLAWARMDLDFDSGEALIEEIQTDWLREVDELRHEVDCARGKNERVLDFWGEDIYVDRALHYLQGELERHRGIWAEAMLSATLHFLTTELGMDTIYYHSFETGAKLKRIKRHLPPRSLYTQLPRQFCFEQVDEAPSFIARDKHSRRVLKKIRDPKWFRMAA